MRPSIITPEEASSYYKDELLEEQTEEVIEAINKALRENPGNAFYTFNYKQPQILRDLILQKVKDAGWSASLQGDQIRISGNRR